MRGKRGIAKRLLAYKAKVAKAKMRYAKKAMEFRMRHLTKRPQQAGREAGEYEVKDG